MSFRHSIRATCRTTGGAVLALLIVGVPAAIGQGIDRLFSTYVQVWRPKGEFVRQLIRVAPPDGGGWKSVGSTELGVRLLVPSGATVDAEKAESRILQVTLPGGEGVGTGVLRVDVFDSQPGEPKSVDEEYAAAYAEQYPRSFGAPFETTDHGFAVVGKKLNLALVGGNYSRAGKRALRLHGVHLGPRRQTLLTFDCAEDDREHHSETLARILLSLSVVSKK